MNLYEWEVLDKRKRKRWVGGDSDSFEEFVEGKVSKRSLLLGAKVVVGPNDTKI